VVWVDEADRTDQADRTDRTDRTERADGVDRCPGPRAMLWAGIGRSYRTRVVWGGCVPRAMLWAGMRCPVGTRGEGRVVESLSGAGPAGWLRKAAAGFRIPRPSAGWFAGCVLLAAGAGDDGEDDGCGDEGGAGEAPCHGARACARAFGVTEP